MPERARSAVTGALERPARAACRRVLRALAAALKAVALYEPCHPTAGAALKELAACLCQAFEAVGAAELALELADGRWSAQGEPLGEAALCEPLAAAFKARWIDRLVIERGASVEELAVLCRLAGRPPGADETPVTEALRARGIRGVRLEAVERGEGASRSAGARLPRAAMGFGAFIKRLVEGSVPDPGERARIYAETLDVVKGAIERRLRDSVRERDRVEGVVLASGEGKIVVDKDGRVLMMDPTAEQIIGKRLVEVAGKPILEQVDAATQIASISEVRRGEEESGVTVRTVAQAEILEAYRGSMAVVQDESGRVVGTYGVLPYIRKLQEAARVKSEFVANVTHDLKAPLAAVASALELLEDEAGGRLSAEERRILAIGRRNCARLARMIEGVLEFSRVETGCAVARPVPTALEPVVREAVEGLEPWARRKGLRLSAAASPGLRALADAGRVVQVIANLLSNAIKATPEGGSINVACARGEGPRAGKVVVSVADTGCGVAPEDQERIFERFVQADGYAGRRDGVGLGLAIVQSLVAQHGGEVWVESQWGRGATFSFSLPAVD